MTLNSVEGSSNVVIPMGLLVGDVNGNGTVNAADIAQTKSRAGQIVGLMNFRNDIDANESITAGDIVVVKTNAGMFLPP